MCTHKPVCKQVHKIELDETLTIMFKEGWKVKLIILCCQPVEHNRNPTTVSFYVLLQ